VGVDELLSRWREDLASWAIPDAIAARAEASPWALPAEVFTNRARRQAIHADGPSREEANRALATPGSVLDVGAGAGAASVGLANATSIIAVDESAEMLARFTALQPQAQTRLGRWPDIADTVPVVDVVLCHHVLYNVPDIGEFLTALAKHAKRRVIVEITELHPMAGLNDLWLALHGIQRPTRPTADDVIAIIEALGYRPVSTRWQRPAQAEFETREAKLRHTAQRLCLPKGRLHELEPLIDRPAPDRRLVTISWAGG
jgi:SAM-dependent methyltransferase